jgi:uncharacterized membrane protein YdjX (TVP38/TMEM64 family)
MKHEHVDNEESSSEDQEESSGDGAEQKGGKQNWYKLILFLLVAALAAYLFIAFDLRTTFKDYFDNTIEPWIKAHPYTGPLAFIGIYIAAVVAFLPGSVITLAGGALFGPIWGTIIVSISSTVGAALAFLAGRFFVRGWVERQAGDRLDTIQEGIKQDGWRYVAFTRLVPIFPFNLQNYVYGMTRIGFWTYVFVSWVAMLPGTFAYVYAGYAAKVAAAGGTGVKKTLIIISIAAGVLILVSMIPKWLKSSDAVDVEPEPNEPADREV